MSDTPGAAAPEPVEVIVAEGWRLGRSVDPIPAVLMQTWNGDGDTATVAIPAHALLPLLRELLNQFIELQGDIVTAMEQPRLEVIEKKLHVAQAIDTGVLP